MIGLRTGLRLGLRPAGADGLGADSIGRPVSTDVVTLSSLLISPDPAVMNSAAALQLTATGTFSDASTSDQTANATWTVSTTPFMTIGASNGQVTPTTWGQINGGSAGVTASIGAVADDVVARVVAFDSGSVRVYLPQSDAQWQALGLSPWGGWWGCQEGSGSDLVGSGSVPFTLATLNTNATARCLWAQPVTAFTRTGLHLSGSGASAGAGWSAASGTGPNLQNTSVALLGYLMCEPVPGNRTTFGWASSTQNHFTVVIQATGIPRFLVSGSATNASSNHVDGRVHPFLLVNDLTNSRSKMYTDLDKVTGSFPATAFYEMTKGFGGIASIPCPSGSAVFIAYATGSVAERLSLDGPASAFLKALGWTNTPW